MQRKVVQAVSYEVLALLVVAPVLVWVFGNSLLLSGLVALATSLIAVAWNMLFNAWFEAWEARQRQPRRTLQRRVLHALGFEVGLLLFTTPLLAYGLDISWWQALLSDLLLMLFYLVYAFFFQWGFDLLFGAPAATLGVPARIQPGR
ncbi:PACE efflux transporter [Pseudomonas sp. N040]|uniref:PACE efflux transporter n=1 Tax=Pseudomonas sp. N040 TaxID=2785325 RepID=UPI001E3F8107